MSLLLALEASTPAIGVGLHRIDTGESLGEMVRPGARGDVLPELIAQLLKDAGASPSDVTQLAAGIGPGSFTGIRAALASAQGFALRRGLPVQGVSSLLAALAHPDIEALAARPRVALLDAYREEVFARRLEIGASALPDRSPDLRRLRHDLSDLAGDPVVLWHGRTREGIPETALDLLEYLRPAGIARLALAGNFTEAVPNYLREAAPVEARLAAGKSV